MRTHTRAVDVLKINRTLAGFIVPFLVITMWELLVRAGWVQARLAPPPSKIFETLLALTTSGELATHVLVTMRRVLWGFIVGAILGTVLGTVTGTLRMAKILFDPTLQALRAVPSIAWIPLFILWMGIFEASKVALIAIGVFFPVYLGVAGAIQSVDRKLIEVGRIFRLSKIELARRVLLPAVLPEWIISLRSGLGLGFMFVVAAEYMGASEGVGYLLIDGQQLGKTAQIIAAILIFAVLGKASDAVLEALARPLTLWQDKAREKL